MSDTYPVRVTVNGAPRDLGVPTTETLLDALRWDLDLTGSKECCAVGPRRTRFAFGAVAPKPFVVDDDSGVLADPASSEEEREQVLRAMTAQASPITDVRGSADYRQAMLLVLSRRALDEARSQPAGG